jgi:hypothetical protein
MPENPRLEVEARSALMKAVQVADPVTFRIKISKRFLPIRGRRAEIYYDGPSLYDLLEKRSNRRTLEFLAKHKMTHSQAYEYANRALDELDSTIGRAKRMFPKTFFDFDSTQVIVTGIDKYGTFDFVMVDL